MATSHSTGDGPKANLGGKLPRRSKLQHRFRRADGRWLLPAGVLVVLLLAGCTSTQPVVKIGLLAPFEGLYRRTGYDALAAARAAVAETPVHGVGVLPLALDTGRDPGRAAAKLLADGGVRAVVGPLTPAQAAGTAPARQPAGVSWLLPFAPPSIGDPAWATGLVKAAARYAAAHGAQGLVLAGWTPGWPQLTLAAWSAAAGLPVRLTDDPTQVQSSEAVFWLGQPAEAAVYLDRLRARLPAAAFWMGPSGGDPVFADHAQHRENVFWVVWTDDNYNAWTERHQPSSPAAYLVYRATVDALHAALGEPADPPPAWQVQVYRLRPDGSSAVVSPAP